MKKASLKQKGVVVKKKKKKNSTSPGFDIVEIEVIHTHTLFLSLSQLL